MVTWQAPKANKVLKIVSKVVQEDFSSTYKKSYWLHLPFFSRIFLRIGGWYTPPPDAINRWHSFDFLNLVNKKSTLAQYGQKMKKVVTKGSDGKYSVQLSYLNKNISAHYVVLQGV